MKKSSRLLTSIFAGASFFFGAAALPGNENRNLSAQSAPAIVQVTEGQGNLRAPAMREGSGGGALADSLPPAASSSVPLIVIDPGHGQINKDGSKHPGEAINETAGLVEIEIIDAVTASLRNILQEAGYEVHMTRESGASLAQAKGNRDASLDYRAKKAANLSREKGRPVIFLSVHVDNTNPGGIAFVHRSAGQDTRQFARAMAQAYRLGDRESLVRQSRYRILRIFEERDRQHGKAVQGVAALFELGNVLDKRDIPHLQDMLRNPEPAARMLAEGIQAFVEDSYQAPKPALQASLPEGKPPLAGPKTS